MVGRSEDGSVYEFRAVNGGYRRGRDNSESFVNVWIDFSQRAGEYEERFSLMAPTYIPFENCRLR